MSSNKNQISQ